MKTNDAGHVMSKSHLLDVVGVAECGVSRGGGAIVVVAHVILVYVRALDVVNVAARTKPLLGPIGLGKAMDAARLIYARVPKIVEVVVHERASVVLKVHPVIVAVRAVVLPAQHPCMASASRNH